mgnify:CR=1 FL=1
MTHPYDYEAPPPSTEGDRAQHQHDERRDTAPAALHLVPPLAAYDIHAKLIEEIRKAYNAGSVDDWCRESGLRAAYRIVFGENAP